MGISHSLQKRILTAQKNEITEHIIYHRLASSASSENKKVLVRIADQELRHYNYWKKYSGTEVQPNRLKISFYCTVAKCLGLNFGLRLMEKGEKSAQSAYSELKQRFPYVKNILKEEERHEEKLIGMLSSEELTYAGSIVLGLNDALVELTGALAGLTFALKDTKIIAAAGLISGIAASLSMAGSEYLSTREEGTKKPLKASVYTGIAYIFVVFFLILPYFLLEDSRMSLAATIITALAIIFIFNFYISVAKNTPFRKRFLEMAAISLGVAALSFFIGIMMRAFLGIEV